MNVQFLDYYPYKRKKYFQCCGYKYKLFHILNVYKLLSGMLNIIWARRSFKLSNQTYECLTEVILIPWRQRNEDNMKSTVSLWII